MDYHLEKQIRLNDKTKYKNLYSWCLEEIDSEGEKSGKDFIPWAWNFHFTASELRLNQGFGFGFGEFPQFGNDEKDEKEDSKEQNFEDSEGITAILHAGICTDGKRLEDNTMFSMFGTDRAINKFSLQIYKVENEGKERCQIWGGVSNTLEIEFRNETSPDSIEINLGLSEARFNKLAKLISTNRIDSARIGLSRVSGFYSEWSPSISTRMVKVLTRGSGHEIIREDGCDINPPRLGNIGKFNMTLITRCKLNPKQDFTALNISKAFEDDDFYEEESEVKEVEDLTHQLAMARIVQKEDLTQLALARIVQNQVEIIKLKTPLWIITFLLGAKILSSWL